MNRYVLDSDVTIALELVAAGSNLGRRPLPVVVTDVVWDELHAPGDPHNRARTFAQNIAGSVTELAPDSAEAETFLSLQATPKTEGPGEHSVIAYCYHHLDTIAVLQDKGALRRAIEELRGRILSFHGFLAALVAEGHIGWEEATVIAARYRRQYVQSRLPVWWP